MTRDLRRGSPHRVRGGLGATALVAALLVAMPSTTSQAQVGGNDGIGTAGPTSASGEAGLDEDAGVTLRVDLVGAGADGIVGAIVAPPSGEATRVEVTDGFFELEGLDPVEHRVDLVSDQATIALETVAMPSPGTFQIAVPDAGRAQSTDTSMETLLNGEAAAADNGVAAAGGSLSGTVSWTETPADPGDFWVQALTPSGGYVFHELESISEDGTWELLGVDPGDAVVKFRSGGTFEEEFYDDASTIEDAQVLTVVEGEHQTGIDAELALRPTISGTVRHEDGTLVDNLCGVQAYVWKAESGGDWSYDGSACTDLLGNYEMGVPAGVPVRVGFDAFFQTSGTYYDHVWTLDDATDVTAPASGVDGVMIEPPANDTVAGVVVGPDGMPVPNAVVHYTDQCCGVPVTEVESTTTDVDGRFSTAALPSAHELSLLVEPTSSGLARYGGVVNTGDFATLRLSAAVEVSGVATDTLGVLASADLQLSLGSYSGIQWSVSTDSTGAFTAGGLPPGQRLTIQTPAHFATELDIPNESSVQDIHLLQSVTLSGTVSDGQGVGLDGLSVDAAWLDGFRLASGRISPSHGSGGANTQADGSWMMRVPAGSAQVVTFGGNYGPYVATAFDGITKSGHVDSAMTAIVSDGSDVAGADAQMVVGATLSGVVTLDGTTTCRGEPVLIDSDGHQLTSLYTVPSPFCDWAFGGVPPGDYRLKSTFYWGNRLMNTWYGGSDFDSAQVITVSAGETKSGLDIHATTRTDVGTIAGMAYPNTSVWVSGPGRRMETYSDDDGSWDIVDVPAGDYQVWSRQVTSTTHPGGLETETMADVAHPGTVDPASAATVSLGSGESVTGLDLTVPPAMGELAVPIPAGSDYFMALWTADRAGTTISVSGSSASDVEVAIPVPAGAHRVYVSDYADGQQEGWFGGSSYGGAELVSVPSGGVATGLPPITWGVEAGLSGTVTDASGAAVPFVPVWVYDDAGEAIHVVATDRNGVYEFPTDEATGYYLEARSPDLGSAWHGQVTPDNGGSAAINSGDGWTIADISYGDPPDVGSLRFVGSVPCAVFDTRSASGPLAGRNDGGDVLTFTVASDGVLPVGQGGAGCAPPPADAVAVELNLVAVTPVAGGNLKVSASGVVAEGGVVNFSPGVTNASSVPVAVDGQGRVDVGVNAAVDDATFVRGVVLGYYVDAAAAAGDGDSRLFVPSEACSVFDTRSTAAGRFDAQETRTFQVAGAFNPAGQGGQDCVPPPAGASGVLVNLVAIGPANDGNLKVVAAGGTAQGGVVNFAGGAGNNSNAVPVGVSGSGAIDVTANTTGDASVDVRGVVLGYYVDQAHASAADGLEFVPSTACAVFDTRSGSDDFGGRLDPAQTVTATVASDASLPAGQGGGGCEAPPAAAEAVMLNLVAIGPRGDGNLQLAPAGTAPDGGVVNFSTGRGTNANAVVTGLAGGQVDVTVNANVADAVHVRGVTLGWYTNPN